MIKESENKGIPAQEERKVTHLFHFTAEEKNGKIFPAQSIAAGSQEEALEKYNNIRSDFFNSTT